MTSASVPRAVIFDMDNTLHSLHEAAQSAADAVSLFFGTEYNLHFTPLNRDRPSMPDEFKDFFGDENTAASAFNLYYKLELLCLREFEGIREVLQKLKDAGICLVILSNSDGHSVYPRLSLMGMDNFFDAVFVRESFPEIKPAPEAFQHVLDFLGMEADEVLMIGDSLKNDVRAARAFGIKAVHAWYGSWEDRDKECFAESPKDILEIVFGKMFNAPVGI